VGKKEVNFGGRGKGESDHDVSEFLAERGVRV